jgi:hypothetical protein
MNDRPPAKTAASHVQAINENLFRAALLMLFALLLAAIVAAIKQDAMTMQQLGIPITVRPVDLLLILGIILAELTAFDFYLNIVTKRGENWKEEYFSLTGMVYMLFLNVLLFVTELFSFRVLLVAVLLGLITIKNGALSKRLKGTKLGERLALWHNNTKWGFFSALGAGLAFLLMFNGRFNRYLVSFFLEGDSIRFKDSYFIWIPLCFYLVLFITCLRAFIRNKLYFYSDEYQANLTEAIPAIEPPRE